MHECCSKNFFCTQAEAFKKNGNLKLEKKTVKNVDVALNIIKPRLTRNLWTVVNKNTNKLLDMISTEATITLSKNRHILLGIGVQVE